MGIREWEAPGANVEAVRAPKENMEEKAADETDTYWRGKLQRRQNRKANRKRWFRFNQVECE